MNHQSDFGYAIPGNLGACIACGSCDLHCCDGHGRKLYHCQWCGVSEDHAVVDRYVCNEVETWLCDECACESNMPAPEPFMGGAIAREIPQP